MTWKSDPDPNAIKGALLLVVVGLLIMLLADSGFWQGFGFTAVIVGILTLALPPRKDQS